MEESPKERSILDIVSDFIDVSPGLSAPATKADVARLYAVMAMQNEASLDQALMVLTVAEEGNPLEHLKEFRKRHTLAYNEITKEITALLDSYLPERNKNEQ